MGVIRSVKRWWRSKGFGIHSPFAFYFVTKVLRESLPYYCYHDIDCMVYDAPEGKSASMPKAGELKALLRIICHFIPSEVYVHPSAPDEISRTIRMADSRIKFSSEPRMFQCYFGDVSPDDLAKKSSIVTDGEGVIVLFRPTRQMKQLFESIEHVMTFSGDAMYIIVSRHDFQTQDFEVNIRP